jgi:mono/diheme cytochrome c family protein
VIRGVVVYQMHCASCHGSTGAGDGRSAADALAPPVDLTRIAARHGGFDRRRVAAWIDGRERVPSHGDAELPVWGSADLRDPGADPLPRRLDDLLDYLEHLQDRGPSRTSELTPP